ncbi:MAG: patatin-like phospholipase family protein [Prolixibacteraceae bacterium]
MKHLILLFLLVTCLSASHAQTVALVLSGGGAKGLAHIGVIKALEENNIPIDYIAGTSMGAIVAGLYASGFSTEEMEKLFRSEQFKFWATGYIQEEYRYYFKKLQETPAWLSFDLEKKEEKLKLLLPTNLIPEEQMDFAFMEMFSSTTAVCNYNFNQLFVPFMCIATDVYNNKEMEIRSGDLGEAIRASMTFPFYFKPIEIDGSLLFDGGIVNNFPVQNAMTAFNPDIIIGHKVANNARKPDEDDVMAQLENLIMQKTDYNVPSQRGVLLETSFSNVSLLDFDKIDLIEEAGYNKAQSVIDSIKTRINRRVSLHEIQKRRDEFNRRKPELKFQNIQVEGVSDPLQRKYIIQSLKHRSTTISLAELRKEYFKLVADMQIRSIRPIAIYNPESGYFDLHLKVKKERPMEIKFGGNISTKPINQGFVSMDYRFFNNRAYTLSTNIYFGRFYSSINLGGRIDFPSSLPFYLSGYLTFNRWDYYASSNEFFFEDVLPPYVIRDENNLMFELGFPVKYKGKLVFGTSFSSSSDEYFVNEEVKRATVADNTDFDAIATQVHFEKNSFNYKQFPTEGMSSFLGLTYIDGKETYRPGSASGTLTRNSMDHQFYILKSNYEKYFKVNRKISIGFLAEGLYSNKKIMSNYRSTLLSAPAFAPVPYSQTLFLPDFRASKYVASGAKFIGKLTGQLHYRAEGYGFAPIKEVIQTENYRAQYNDQAFSTFKTMAMGGLVYHTGMGPVSLSLNYFDNQNTKLFVVFSFGYVLFNQRGY